MRCLSVFSLPFWGLWFLMRTRGFCPFQVSHLRCIPIGTESNEYGLIMELQDAFESLKLGLYSIRILYIIFAWCDQLKIGIFHSYRRWFLFILLSTVLSPEFGFCFPQTVGAAAVRPRVPAAGPPGGLGRPVRRRPHPDFGWLRLRGHVALHPRCL